MFSESRLKIELGYQEEQFKSLLNNIEQAKTLEESKMWERLATMKAFKIRTLQWVLEIEQ